MNQNKESTARAYLKAALPGRGQPVHEVSPGRGDAFYDGLSPLLLRTCPGLTLGANSPIGRPRAKHGSSLLDRCDMLCHLHGACYASICSRDMTAATIA